MNKIHKPNEKEFDLIKLIETKVSKGVTMRITPNMLLKHHIDAIKELRSFLNQNGLVDFSLITDGNKKINKITIVDKTMLIETIISFNRSSNRENKIGDARFWIPKIKGRYSINDLMVFFFFEKELFVLNISATSTEQDITQKIDLLQTKSFSAIKKELIDKFKEIRKKGFIKSISPKSRYDKDAGETFENAIGMPSNSSKKADFKEQIEIKSKSEKTSSKDSCFNRIPDEDISPIKTTKQLVLKYGYPDNNSTKYPGYLALFIEVGKKANNRGFYLEIDEVNEYVVMKHKQDGVICRWHFKVLKSRLETKHPATLWLTVKEKFDEDGDICFSYSSAQITIKSDFAAFIQLISEGKVVYNWRARVRVDGTGYDDHGNGFRLGKKDRKQIFGIAEEILYQ